jgi:hypothetical protein
MVNKTLKNDLLKKLGITPQALSQRAQRIKKSIPMTTEDAISVIAWEKGLKIEKYLGKEAITKIRQLRVQLSPVNSTVPRNRQNKSQKENIIIISGGFKVSDPLLESSALNQAKEMAAVYPYIYILENSIRKFICLIMEKEYGSNWWDTVSGKLKKKVIDRMKKENENSWHQRRGAREIDYLDLDLLPNILDRVIVKITPDILPSKEWLRNLIDEVYISRCVLCHMNPLEKNSIDSIKVKFNQWQKQMKAKIDKINALSLSLSAIGH